MPVVPTCVGAAAQPLAAKGIQREPDCSEVQSLGNSDHVKSMSVGNYVHWEQGGGWFEAGLQGLFSSTQYCRANRTCASLDLHPCQFLAPV